MRTHHLKTWPEPFEAVFSGAKTFEIRRDDRGFAVGDTLVLQEWDPAPLGQFLGPRGYTRREVRVRVTYVAHSRWGLPQDLCVMSIERIAPPQGDIQ